MIIAFLLQQIGVDKNDIPDISYVSYYCIIVIFPNIRPVMYAHLWACRFSVALNLF